MVYYKNISDCKFIEIQQNSMSIRIKVHITLLLSVFLSGCGLFGGDEDDNEFAGLSTEAQFYERALDQLNGQNFRAAISTYQAL